MAGITVLVPLLLFALVLSTYNLAAITTRRLRRKRIGLLIAHPDDEAMFFAPSVIQLCQEGWANDVYVACLSNGNAEGLGSVRSKELAKSLSMMGVPAKNVRCLDDPAFPDSMTKNWETSEICSVLSDMYIPKPEGKRSKETSAPNIDILITFDQNGVSSHPNHTSLLKGARQWCLERKTGGHEVELYTLTSTNIARKYSGWFDLPFTVVSLAVNMFQVTLAKRRASPRSSTKKRAAAKGEEASKGLPFLFISSLWTWRVAQATMTDAHVSQMRWFRYGWIYLSRYMLVNDLRSVSI